MLDTKESSINSGGCVSWPRDEKI